jgi:hypothetical protein
MTVKTCDTCSSIGLLHARGSRGYQETPNGHIDNSRALILHGLEVIECFRPSYDDRASIDRPLLDLRARSTAHESNLFYELRQPSHTAVCPSLKLLSA